MSAILGNLVLRAIPDALLAGVGNGSYRLYGSIIREVASGHVVGHLQEAGGIGALIDLIGSGPLAPIRAVTGVVQVVQTERIRAGVARVEAGMATLTQLGAANLALGAVGIGVTVASHVVLARKIDHLKRVLESVADRLLAGMEELKRELVERDMDRLRALAVASDEGWTLGAAAAERQWHDIAYDAGELAAVFERRARLLLTGGAAALPVAEPMLDALAAAGGLHVAARAAAGEVAAACAAARVNADAVERLTGAFGIADLAVARVREWGAVSGTAAWGHALTTAKTTVQADIARLRARESATATRAAPLIELDRRGVAARDWLEAARMEADAPLLVLLSEADA